MFTGYEKSDGKHSSSSSLLHDLFFGWMVKESWGAEAVLKLKRSFDGLKWR